MQRPVLTVLLAATMPALLGGCVAAVIPIAAGGAIAGKDELGIGKKGSKPAEAQDPAETQTVASEVPAAASLPEAAEPVEPIVRDRSINGEEMIAENTNPPERVELPPTDSAVAEPDTNSGTTAGTSPASAPPARPGAAQAANVDPRAYDVLYDYVDQQSRRDPIDNPRQSAILAAPGALRPDRSDCSIRPSAILIDLDPAGGVFDPDIAAERNPSLSQMLAALRLQEVDVFWISKLPAVRAGALRRVLIQSGMDPAGRDGLLLMRKIGDRKQLRRRELGETHCLLAIAGDERADFDELYLYLKDNAAAQPLEELIGAGWFMTPLPLTEGHTP